MFTKVGHAKLRSNVNLSLHVGNNMLTCYQPGNNAVAPTSSVSFHKYTITEVPV